MESEHTVVTIGDRIAKWREADQAAKAAQEELRQLGQAGSDPRVRDLALRARSLREEADRQFAWLVRAVRMDEGSGPGAA